MKHTIKLVGLIDDNNWKHYLWSVTINTVHFNYKTGIGLVKPNGQPSVPKIDEVMYCLVNDIEFGAMSFDDFCDNCGYSNDSLNALNIYRECSENEKKLRKALGKEYNEEVNRINKLREEGLF